MFSRTTAPQANDTKPPQPDLALGDTLPAPKPRRCLGCGKPWVGGHSCLTPSSPPTTDRRVHEAGTTRLYEDRPNAAGQWVTLLHYRCGHTRLSCTRSEAAMLEERGLACEALCPTCAYRASRSELDEEAIRG